MDRRVSFKISDVARLHHNENWPEPFPAGTYEARMPAIYTHLVISGTLAEGGNTIQFFAATPTHRTTSFRVPGALTRLTLGGQWEWGRVTPDAEGEVVRVGD